MIEIIAKIESQTAIDNIDDIIAVVDGIMVARGDLGVEVPMEALPSLQKTLIKKARAANKRVITATEMLESMIVKPRPTRAETSDVANAVYDGTGAVMLSGETAAGSYPVQAVKAMSDIAAYTEQAIHYRKRFVIGDFEIDTIPDAVCASADAQRQDGKNHQRLPSLLPHHRGHPPRKDLQQDGNDMGRATHSRGGTARGFPRRRRPGDEDCQILQPRQKGRHRRRGCKHGACGRELPHHRPRLNPRTEAQRQIDKTDS